MMNTNDIKRVEVDFNNISFEDKARHVGKHFGAVSASSLNENITMFHYGMNYKNQQKLFTIEDINNEYSKLNPYICDR